MQYLRRLSLTNASLLQVTSRSLITGHGPVTGNLLAAAVAAAAAAVAAAAAAVWQQQRYWQQQQQQRWQLSLSLFFHFICFSFHNFMFRSGLFAHV